MQNAFSDILNPLQHINPSNASDQSLHSPGDQQILVPQDESPVGASGSNKRQQSRLKSSYPRKRAIQACQKCRIRRTKCDNLRPSCSACIDLKVECNYSDADPSSFDAASLAILDRLGTLEQLLRENSAQKTPPSASAESLSSPVKTPHSTPHGRPIEDSTFHLNVESILSWPVFSDQHPDIDLKRLLRLPASDVLPSIPPIGSFDHVPEERLIERFIDSVLIFNPVIEEAKIQKYLSDSRYTGLLSDAQHCLLLLIYANGSLADTTPAADAYASRQDVHFKRAESFFVAAQQLMGFLFSQSGIIESQCFFLAGVYLMATMRPLDGWRMFVQALACCQTMCGPDTMSNVSTDAQSKLRRSLWWTCFKSELEVRLDLHATDISVWDLRYPTFFPSPPEELKAHREIVWYYYLAEIALRRLENRVLNFIYTDKSQDSISRPIGEMTEIINTFEQQARDWITSLPKELDFTGQYQQTPDQGNLNQTLRFILKGELCDCYEMMYWPFFADAVNDINAIINKDVLYKSLVNCVERIDINEPGFYFRHHGTWSMLRACTRSALMLLAAQRTSTIQQLLPPNWKVAVRKVVDMLRYWRRESADLANRLDLLERMWQNL